MFGRRTLALALGLAVAVPTLAPTPDAEAAAPPPRTAAPMQSVKEREVVERTERTTTYRNPDGSFTTETRAGKVNFRDADGTWKAIDARLRSRDGRVENGAGPLKVSFAPKASKDDVVEVKGRGWSAAFGLEGSAAAKAQAEDYRIVYPDVFPGMDLSYVVTAEGFKEYVVVKATPSAPVALRFPMKLRGVAARASADGGIRFLDSAGTEVARIPPGVAFDSSGDRSRGDEPARTPVANRLVESPEGLVLELELDQGWLRDPARVLPIRIDPSFDAGHHTAGGDAYGRSDQPNTTFNSGTQTDDGVRYKNKIGYNGPEFVSAAKFDLSPAMNKTIIAATWYGFLYDSNPLHQIQMWRVTGNWDESTMTFNNRPGHDGNQKSLNPNGNNAWMSHDVTDFVQHWTTPNDWPNYGVVYDMGGQSGYYALASDEMSYFGEDSFIRVNWQEKPPTINGATDSPDPVNPGGTVSFTVNWSDPFDQARAVVCRTNFAANGDCASAGDRFGVGGLSSNGTSTTSYTTTNADRGISFPYYAFACDASGACSSSVQGTFFVNNPRPSITSAADAPDPVVAGDQVTFSVGWSDTGETNAKALVCKTNATSGTGCTSGNTWTIGNETGSSPATASYTTTASDIGTQTYFAFACDRSSCSSSSISGTFTVNAPNPPPSIGTASDSPDPVAVNATQTFSVGWTDAGDSVKAVVCKTNDVNSGACPGGAWAIGSFGTTSPATVTRTAAQADVGTRNYWAFACDDGGACSSSRSGSFIVTNNAPTLSSASDSPDPVSVGGTVTFSVGWTDPGDTVKAVVCKTDAVSNGTCSGGTWVSGTLGATSPSTASYTAVQGDVGTRTYYAFACDSLNVCSTSGPGTFMVNNVAPTVGTVTDSPDPVGVGGTVTFSVGWTDPGDTVKAVVCKTNAVSAGACTGGSWAVGGLGSTSPSTASYGAVQADVGARTYYAFACDASNACSSSVSGTFTVSNNVPVIGTATDAPDPAAAGATVDFTVSWTDPGDTVRAVVCKTNAVSAATCPGGAWAVGSPQGGGSSVASYATVQADVGTQPYFAFACDSANACSSSFWGNFTVTNAVPGITSASDSPDPVAAGSTLTFTVGWNDGGGDSNRALICRTDAVSAGACTGGAWATGSLSSTSPSTASYVTTQADVGSRSYYAFACDASDVCSSSLAGSFTVTNNVPAIGAVSDSPDPVNAGSPVTYSVGWTDAADTVRAVVCKTNAVSAGACAGGTWAAGTLGSASPATATYSTTQADVGTRTYFAFACDSTNACSSSVSGTFTVQNRTPTLTAASDSPDPVNVGSTVTFSTTWSDPTDTARTVVCKTNAVSAATCPGGAWAIGALGSSPTTATYTTAQNDLGTRSYWAFACDASGACSSSVSGTFTVNNVTPTLTSVSDSPDPAAAGTTVDFAATWADAGDTARAVICKTNSVSAGSCPGGAWAVGSLTAGGSSVASFTTAQANLGANAYFAFACDSTNACSSSLSGTFTVTNAAPGIVSASDSPDPVNVGSAVTFSVGWNDGGGDTNKAVICKTNAVSAGTCPGGSWATGSLGSTSPSTASYTTVQADVGTRTYYAFACDSANVCSSSLTGSFTVNDVSPTIGTVSDSPDPVNAGSSVTFSVGWTDPGDTVKAVVCKTNAVSAGSCSGGAWASGSLGSSSPSTASYAATQSDVGTRTYFAFACDSANVCSSSVSGTFTVNNVVPTIGTVTDAPDPVMASNALTFTVSWTDGGGDTVKVVVCKTDAVSAGSCTGGAWASGSPGSTSPSTVAYTTAQVDVGTRSYWAFACDSANACSSSASGTFTVNNGTPTISSVADAPDPAAAGATVDFSVGWTDGGDTVRAVVCKTNAVSASATCPGGAWAIGSLQSGGSSTSSYPTVQADVGTRSYWAFACDSANACSSSLSGTFTVTNAVPGITSAHDSPDPVGVGSVVTFSVGWNDGGGDSGRAVVCKTNAVSASATCPGGAWAIGSLSASSPATANHTATQADVGTRSYWAFACDSANACSSSLSGTFTVNNVVPTIGAVSDSPDPTTPGTSITFSAGWTDPGDTARAVICRTNATSGGSCAGGTWAVGSLGSTSPATVTLAVTQAQVGTQAYYAFVCDSVGACSWSVTGSFTVNNAAPTIGTASDAPDPASVGSAVTFSAAWNDPTDTVRAVVCKTNAVSTGSCPGGAWAIGELTATSPAIVAYTPVQSDIGSHAYWAFVCDSLNVCSPSVTGTFTVQNRTPTANSAEDAPDPVIAGDGVGFSVEWTDPGDTVKAVICKTNAVSAGTCPGGAWAIGSASPSSPATTAYTTSEADIGTRSYWAFACDSPNACSTSVAGSFTVEPYTEAVPPAPTASTDGAGLEDFHPYQPFGLGTGTAFVNTASRNLTVQYRDLAVPGHGLNLGLSRTYNANRSGLDGPVGKGWSLAVTDAPSSGMGRGPGVLATDTQFAFEDADGTRQSFVKDAAGLWRSPTGVNLVASNGTDGQGAWWVATRPDGVRYEFRLVGLTHHLTRITDRKGNSLAFAYVAGRIAAVTDSTNRTITFTWTNGYVSRARYQAGTSTYDVAYAVNTGTATLTSVTEAQGTGSARTTSFGYTASPPMLTSVSDARGATTAFAYGAGAVLTGLTDRAAKAWAFTTGAACLADTPSGLTATCVVDPEAKKETWITSAGNLVERRDRGDRDEAGNARTNRRTYVWVDNRLRRAVDEAGNLHEFDWNGLGLLIATRLSGGLEAPLATEFNYSTAPLTPAVGDLTDIKVASGTTDERHWMLAYDAEGKGLVTGTTDPSGSTATFEYYGVRGLPKRAIDANGHATTFGDTTLADGGYHASGQVRRVTDPAGATTLLEYDFLGRLVQRTDRTNKQWAMGYDLRGNLTSEADPDNRTTLHCYDANDNEVLTVRPKAASPSCALDGTDGYSTKVTFDARDLVESVLTASDGQRRKSTYAYFDDGELKEILEPRSFDPVTALPSATVQKVRYERYDNNRVSAFFDELGNRSDAVYTADGLPRTFTDPPSDLGRHSVTYDYNKLRLVRSEVESGHAAPKTYQYNIFGEQVAQTTPLGSTTISQYDRVGRLTATINAHGRSSTRTYDQVGNLLSVTQPAGILASLTTNYTYTSRGEISSETDPADPQHVIEYTYDGEGRQRFKRDHYGVQVPGDPVEGPVERTTEQKYDNAGRMTERISTFAGTSTGGHRAVFGYDDNGNTSKIDTYADGSTTVSQITATHTTADELKTWTETLHPPSGPPVTKLSTYGYAQDGLLSSRTVDGHLTTYEHTLTGHESKTTPWSLSPFDTFHYASGLPSRTVMANSATVDYGYDLADRMRSKVVRHPTGAVFSAWEHIAYDDDDNRLSEVVTQRDTAGATRTGTGHNIYDKLNRLIASKHPLEVSLVPYVLDDAGNVLTEANWAYAYLSNRLITRSAFPSVGTTSVYGYDHFGNRTTETQGTNVATTNYDAASHTSSFNDFGGFGISYEYDGLDRQVRRFDASNTYTLVFHDGPTDGVALELETNGTGKTTTTRFVLDSTGKALANEEGVAPAAPDRGYYVTDPRHNLTQLLDHNAVGTGPDVVAVFGYDPFGSAKPGLTSAKPKPGGSGTWDSRLRFQLAPRDKHTGQYAMGPRMYDPATNRFVGADWVASAVTGRQLQLDPLTGNRYLYAGANPANLIDDGHAPKKGKKPQSPPSSLEILDCRRILSNIKRLKDKCARRVREFKENRQGFKPGSPEEIGHQTAFQNDQAALRAALDEWNSKGCGGKGAGPLPSGVWQLATRRVPRANQDPARFHSPGGFWARVSGTLRQLGEVLTPDSGDCRRGGIACTP